MEVTQVVVAPARKSTRFTLGERRRLIGCSERKLASEPQNPVGSWTGTKGKCRRGRKEKFELFTTI